MLSKHLEKTTKKTKKQKNNKKHQNIEKQLNLNYLKNLRHIVNRQLSSEFRGERLQGFDLLGFDPLCTILRHPFWLMDPKMFLKSPLASIIFSFKGELCAPKNRGFFGQSFLINF